MILINKIKKRGEGKNNNRNSDNKILGDLHFLMLEFGLVKKISLLGGGKREFLESIFNVKDAAFILYKSEKSNKIAGLFFI
jgi:hypothetical protein